jgi:hypothetical protein
VSAKALLPGERRSDEGLVAFLLDLNGLIHGRNEIGLPAAIQGSWRVAGRERAN